MPLPAEGPAVSAESHGDGDAMEETKPQQEATRPRRVESALKNSKSFEGFRKNMPFKFMHLHSGPNDPLGQASQL